MVVSTTCGGVHLSQCFNSYVYTVADRGVQKKTDAEDRDEVLVWYYGFVVFEMSYISYHSSFYHFIIYTKAKGREEWVVYLLVC